MNQQEFVLPADVRIFRLTDLHPAIRSRLAMMSDDFPFGITRVGSRRTSKLLDEAAAGLLAEFRVPSSVVDAVLRFSRDRQADPEVVLDEAFALLRTLVAAGFLVPPGAALDTVLAASLGSGEHLGQWRIRHALRVLRDTEVYLAEGPDAEAVVIKLVTPDAEPWVRRALSNEAALLTMLGGPPAPRLMAAELEGAAPYLVLEHCPGKHADAAAAELRRPWVADSRKAVLALCEQIARAYEALHDLGVIHGDVNPNNVLVNARAATVRLLDFGFGRSEHLPGQQVPRGGMAPFFEPEYARAMLDGTALPPPGYASEQYGLAALLYGLITGSNSTNARLDRTGFLESVCTDPPRPFSQLGLPPWPDVEGVLSRALAKSPADRFPSIREFADALGQARRAAAVISTGPGPAAGYPMVAGLLGRLCRDPLSEPLPGPAASVNYGAAGIAYLCYRAAGSLGRSDLLDAAELWVERAKREQQGRDGFYNDRLGITESAVGRRALYHCAAGIHLVEALVAASLGNLTAARAAASAFSTAAAQPGPEQDDLTTGTAGLLLGFALLCDRLPAGAAGASPAGCSPAGTPARGCWQPPPGRRPTITTVLARTAAAVSSESRTVRRACSTRCCSGHWRRVRRSPRRSLICWAPCSTRASRTGGSGLGRGHRATGSAGPAGVTGRPATRCCGARPTTPASATATWRPRPRPGGTPRPGRRADRVICAAGRPARPTRCSRCITARARATGCCGPGSCTKPPSAL